MIPLPTDPKHRQDLDDWLKRRRAYFESQGKAEPPLSAREYLMVQRLQAQRPAYSLT